MNFGTFAEKTVENTKKNLSNRWYLSLKSWFTFRGPEPKLLLNWVFIKKNVVTREGPCSFNVIKDKLHFHCKICTICSIEFLFFFDEKIISGSGFWSLTSFYTRKKCNSRKRYMQKWIGENATKNEKRFLIHYFWARMACFIFTSTSNFQLDMVVLSAQPFSLGPYSIYCIPYR